MRAMKGLGIWAVLVMTAAAPCVAGTLKVEGQGEVRYVPEFADLSFGVGAQQPDPQAAFDAAKGVAERIMAICTETGIASRDVKTSHMSLGVAWKEKYGEEVFDGYSATINLSVRLRDTKQVEPFTVRVLQAGVNGLSSVSFGTDDSRRYRDEARLMALRAAREKAQAMAKELGQTLGPAESVEVESESDGIRRPVEREWSNNISITGVAGRLSGSVALGEEVAIAKVTVVFGLK